MLFRDLGLPTLAISQPAHAWISGQLLRAWADDLPEPLLLAAELHDIGWLDWELDPLFDPAGRPVLFRDVGAATHAPMWNRGVERALAAWGCHVALLISRHGGVIYRRFTDRHRVGAADADAAEAYLADAASRERAWADSLGLDAATLARQSALLALSDTLSLALCGELRTPLDVEADGVRYRLERGAEAFALSPWPFREPSLTVACEARPLPAPLPDRAAMRRWLADAPRVRHVAHLRPG